MRACEILSMQASKRQRLDQSLGPLLPSTGHLHMYQDRQL